MSRGKTPTHPYLHTKTAKFCRTELSETSFYRLLEREGGRLFPDEAFADLYARVGRRSIPPRIVASVMVLQRLEGLSDREAVERFKFDLRWKFAAGGLEGEYPGFVHTVLVDMRARLQVSQHPDRIFEAVLEVAKQAGLVGRKRVLDSTALYDAVATQDTVTMVRSAIRGVLAVAGGALSESLRGALKRDDAYTTAGKPVCEWDDAAARAALVDALARDGYAVLAVLDGLTLTEPLASAAKLLATVLGQDLEEDDQGRFRIARRVAPDRVISTVDPETRHGHKTAARGFDGYKGHIAIDPDSEIVTAIEVTAGNAGDATVAEALLADVLPAPGVKVEVAPGVEVEVAPGVEVEVAPSVEVEAAPGVEVAPGVEAAPAPGEGDAPGSDAAAPTPGGGAATASPVEVYGDASYGTADLVETLEAAGIEANVKVQSPSARKGMYSKDAFTIDVEGGKVRCPNDVEVALHLRPDGRREGDFGSHCAGCPLRAKCTDSKAGRKITVHPKHEILDRARKRQRDPGWKKRYRSTRPKVERKFGQMMRRRHGGRCARVRGRARVRQEFAMVATVANLKRLAALGVAWRDGAWCLPAAAL